MKPLPEMKLNPMVQAAVDACITAKAELATALSVAQDECEHRFVFEHPYIHGSWGKIANAHRICRHCRLVEEGSHWSGGGTWSAHDYSKPTLGNVEGRVVSEISRDEFFKLRISD